jgi:hypothetical protein
MLASLMPMFLGTGHPWWAKGNWRLFLVGSLPFWCCTWIAPC